MRIDGELMEIWPNEVCDREIEEELFDEDNALESKMTRDCCLSLRPSKRLKSHPLFREEHLE